MCTAPRRRLTAVGQSLAGSYDIYGCVARAVVSTVTCAPTPVAAPSRFGPSPSTRRPTRFSIIAVVVAAMYHDDVRCPGVDFEPAACLAVPQWGRQVEGNGGRGFFFLRARLLPGYYV